MRFSPPLVQATLVRRYKRFLADVELAGGEQITVHCPNTGSMTGCAEPGCRVWLAHSGNPKRKYSWTWQLVETGPGELACVHSAQANTLVQEALGENRLAALGGYPRLEREVRYGTENSRIDFLLSREAQRCFVEVKSVTLHAGNGLGLFPDAISSRGARHLRELQTIVHGGQRAVLCYVVQNTGISRVAPASAIDPQYTRALQDALAAGVEVVCYRCDISVAGIVLAGELQFISNPSATGA